MLILNVLFLKGVFLSKRVVDINGWITIKDNPILKAGIFPYLGSEMFH